MHCYIHVELGNPVQHPRLCRLMEKLELSSLVGSEPRWTGLFMIETGDGSPDETLSMLTTLAWAEGIDVRRMSAMRFASRAYTGLPPKGEVLLKLLALHAKARKRSAPQAGKPRLPGRAGKRPLKTARPRKRA